jgi:L-asparaginase II
MENPIIADVKRGGIVESVHRGAFVVVDAQGKVLASAGDIARPIYPRSAIKAFQALPLLQSGGAQALQLSDEELALLCASHDGEPDHVRVAGQILHKCGCAEHHYECGSHWPSSRDAANALLRGGQKPRAIHNNCSGKHAGMIAMANHLGVEVAGYVKPQHAVQQNVAKAMGDICDVNLAHAPMAMDGCSVPTWAMGLRNMALGFARLSQPDHVHGQKLIAAVRAHPFMVAGSQGFDTRIMQAVPRLFIKFGAEAVHCGVVAHAGIGFAMKCDDGAKRAVEVAVARMLAGLGCWTEAEETSLMSFASEPMVNWQKHEVGMIAAHVGTFS